MPLTAIQASARPHPAGESAERRRGVSAAPITAAAGRASDNVAAQGGSAPSSAPPASNDAKTTDCPSATVAETPHASRRGCGRPMRRANDSMRRASPSRAGRTAFARQPSP